jgi:hypothetical protein
MTATIGDQWLRQRESSRLDIPLAHRQQPMRQESAERAGRVQKLLWFDPRCEDSFIPTATCWTAPSRSSSNKLCSYCSGDFCSILAGAMQGLCRKKRTESAGVCCIFGR